MERKKYTVICFWGDAKRQYIYEVEIYEYEDIEVYLKRNKFDNVSFLFNGGPINTENEISSSEDVISPSANEI